MPTDDGGRLAADEIGRQPWKPIQLIVSPAKVDGNVLAFDESGLLQPLSERGDKLRRAGSGCAAEKTDHRHWLLLRARRERPRDRRAADKRDELASFHHSITSSARASSVGGTSSPIAVAALTLIAISYLVGVCTGELACLRALEDLIIYSAACRYCSAMSVP
jgi:hypothetical protein